MRCQGRWAGWVVVVVALPACTSATPPATPRGYSVVATYPHDTSAYTQGLILESDGMLLESTGLYGHSSLRRVPLESGAPTALVQLPEERFGEGIALLDGRLYLLTWQSEIAYVYDAQSFGLVDSLTYDGEGWGLTTDGAALIMSDGSDTIRVRHPQSFEVQRSIGIRFASGAPVGKLNELEYVAGELFANVYQSDWIVRIDMETGIVAEVLDLSGLMPGYQATGTADNVLNGIAYDPATANILVTGKRWPKLFALKLDRAPGRM